MLGLKLVRLIEEHSDELALGLTDKLRHRSAHTTSVRFHLRGCAGRRPRFTTTWESGCCRRQKRILRNAS